jgi:hypothetical protein
LPEILNSNASAEKACPEFAKSQGICTRMVPPFFGAPGDITNIGEVSVRPLLAVTLVMAPIQWAGLFRDTMTKAKTQQQKKSAVWGSQGLILQWQ